MAVIYALVDPDVGVRYVGCTTQRPKRRLQHHINHAQTDQTYKARWLRRLLNEGHEPLLTVLEEVAGDQADTRERYWIQFFRCAGFRLTNLTDGGGGAQGYKPTAETIEKYASKLRGRPKSLAHRRKLADAHRGMKATPETRRKMSEAHKGRPATRTSGPGEQHSNTRLTEKQATQILHRVTNGDTQAALAREHDVSESCINALVSGRNWSYLQALLIASYGRGTL